jgi:rubrerythrin
MKYEYKDTFIKKCSSSTNDIGECERSRESVKCINDVCTKVNNPKNKKEILQEHYNFITQDGSGPDPSIKRKLLHNLKKKHRCPYCKEYKHISSLIEHIGKHKSLPPKKRHKTLTGGCGACMIGGAVDTSCPFCKKSVSIHSLIKHIHSHKGQPTKNFLVGGCAACMIGGQSGGGKKAINEAKETLMHNLKNKYRCPICHKYKHLHDMETQYHINAPTNTPLTGVPDKVTHHPDNLKLVENMMQLSVTPPREYKVGRFTLSGSGKKQFYGKKSSIMVKVPTNVKNTALYAFKLRKLGFKGGKETGIKRMKQLATKESIPIEDLRFMRAWFARHVFTSYPSYRKWQKAGRPKDKVWHNKHGILSWLIWSGDAGFKWVNSTKNINLLNKHYPGKNYKKIKIPKA